LKLFVIVSSGERNLLELKINKLLSKIHNVTIKNKDNTNY